MKYFSFKEKRNIWLGLFFLFSILFIDQILINTRISEVDFMLDSASQNMLQRLSGAKALVEMAAGTSDVSVSFPPKAEVFLEKEVAKNPDLWSHFLVAHPDGTEFVHTDSAQHYGKSIAKRDYFLVPNEKKETIIAQPTFSVSTGRKIIAIGTPVFHKTTGDSVLVGFIYLQYVSQVLNDRDFSKNSYQIMATSDGTVAAHPDESLTLSTTLEKLFGASPAAKIQRMEKGHMLAMVDGRLNYISYTPLLDNGLLTITVMPFIEAFGNVLFIDAMLLLMFISLLSIFIYHRRLKSSASYAEDMAMQAFTDRLTGIKNRRWLDCLSIDNFCKTSFIVVFLDIDNFKNFNDLHNHDYGDEVLRYVGESLVQCTSPENDVCIRYAGDEFIILLRDTDMDSATLIVNRLTALLNAYKNDAGQLDPIYISCGIAHGDKHTHTLSETITRADNAVYRAKHQGKNQIVVSD